MVAARARGRGTRRTGLPLFFAAQAAELLDIPYADVRPAGLIPVAYTTGTPCKPGRRAPLATVVHGDTE
jgi:hypothetical protein